MCKLQISYIRTLFKHSVRELFKSEVKQPNNFSFEMNEHQIKNTTKPSISLLLIMHIDTSIYGFSKPACAITFCCTADLNKPFQVFFSLTENKFKSTYMRNAMKFLFFSKSFTSRSSETE